MFYQGKAIKGSLCVSLWVSVHQQGKKHSRSEGSSVATTTLFPRAKTLEACELGSATQKGRVPRTNTGGHTQVSAA